MFSAERRIAAASDLRRLRRGRSAFTLIELVLVMVIIGILAAVVVPKLIGRSDKAKVAAAQSDVATLSSALDTFEVDNSKFPTTEEGLNALVNNPGNLPNWKHSYVDRLPNDPWGHAYIYRCPGNNGKDYDLLSGGPDGHEGGDDDITNH
jgi:general secretion pathway protein G